jgi:hypothetical protein
MLFRERRVFIRRVRIGHKVVGDNAAPPAFVSDDKGLLKFLFQHFSPYEISASWLKQM